VSCAVINVQVS